MSQLLARVMRHPIQRPSRALVVAGLAVFISLTGTAYAANTVGSSDIIDEAILSQDIKNGEVSSDDVLDNSLTFMDINMANLPGVAHKFSYIANANADPTMKTTFLNYAGFLFKGTCLLNGAATQLILREAGPSVWLDYSLVESANDPSHPTSETASQTLRGDRDGLTTGIDRPVLAVGGPDPNSGKPYMLSTTGDIYRRAQGTGFLTTGSGATLRIDIDAIADNHTHKCSILGTITLAV